MARDNQLKWDGRAGAAANAQRLLPQITSEYFAQVRAFLKHDRHPRELHEMRLATKKLRYTLELFRSCYPAELNERLEALKVLQDCLGEVNDAAASAELLDKELKRRPKLRRFLDERAAERAAEFARQWQVFDAPGREAWWTSFLARPNQ